MKERLLKEVLAPCWYAIKSLGSILTSEEALYAYLSIVITLVVFLVECWDESISTARWAVGSLIDLGEPEVCEMYVDENLYLMPSHDSWEMLGADVEEVVSWWKATASEVFGGDVIDAEFWGEDSTLLLEGAGSLLCLPSCKEVPAPQKKVKRARK